MVFHSPLYEPGYLVWLSLIMIQGKAVADSRYLRGWGKKKDMQVGFTAQKVVIGWFDMKRRYFNVFCPLEGQPKGYLIIFFIITGASKTTLLLRF